MIVFLNRGPESVSERGARRRAAALTKVSSAGQSPRDDVAGSHSLSTAARIYVISSPARKEITRRPWGLRPVLGSQPHQAESLEDAGGFRS